MKKLVKRCKIDVLHRQESKSEESEESIMKEIGGFKPSNGLTSPTKRWSSGIMILLNHFEVDEVEEDRQVNRAVISLHFWITNDLSWNFLGVYDPQSRERKILLWE